MLWFILQLPEGESLELNSLCDKAIICPSTYVTKLILSTLINKCSILKESRWNYTHSGLKANHVSYTHAVTWSFTLSQSLDN